MPAGCLEGLPVPGQGRGGEGRGCGPASAAAVASSGQRYPASAVPPRLRPLGACRRPPGRVPQVVPDGAQAPACMLLNTPVFEKLPCVSPAQQAGRDEPCLSFALPPAPVRVPHPPAEATAGTCACPQRASATCRACSTSGKCGSARGAGMCWHMQGTGGGWAGRGVSGRAGGQVAVLGWSAACC